MSKGIGIKTRVVIATISFMGILTLAISIIGYKLYKDSIMKSYHSYADAVLKCAYNSSIRYSFGDMIASRTMTGKYEEFRKELNMFKESSDIEYLYAIYFDDMEDQCQNAKGKVRRRRIH